MIRTETNALEQAANFWWHWMSPMAWQAALLVCVLAFVTWCLQGRSARTRYALWMLLPARLVLPPTLALITGWGWWMLPASEPPGGALAQPAAVTAEPVENLLGYDPASFDAANPPAPGTWADLTYKRHQAANTNGGAAPASKPVPDKSALLSGRAWLFLAWIAGVFLFAARLAIGAFRARKMVFSAIPVSDPAILALAESCRKRVGVRQRVELRTLDSATVPMLLGAVHPKILLPTRVVERLTSEELEAVLTHEFVHVARGDAVMNLLQSVLGVVYFFHPFVWFGSRMIARLREDACDEATVAVLDGRRRDYGSGIVKVAEMIAGPSPTMALGIVESRTHVSRRLARILDPRLPLGRRLSWPAALAILLLAAVLLPAGSRPRAAEEGKSKDAPAKSTAVATAIDKPKESAKPVDEMAIVRGIVVDAAGKVVEGVQVSIDFHEGRAESRTDSSGKYELSLPAKRGSGQVVWAIAGGGERQGSFIRPWGVTSGTYDAQIKLAPARRVEIDVVDQSGAAVPEADIGIMGEHQRLTTGKTDDAGRATILIPKDFKVGYVFAMKQGKGLDYRAYVLPRGQQGDKQTRAPELPDVPLRLTLERGKPVRVRAVDSNLVPLSDVKIYPWTIKKPDQHQDMNLSFFTELVSIGTNEAGDAIFDWLPPWPEKHLTFWPKKEGYTRPRGTYDTTTGDGKLVVTLDRLVPLRGKVTLPDGTPAANVIVRASGDGREVDGFDVTIKTDLDGRYEMHVAPDMLYMLVINDTEWAAPAQDRFVVRPDTPLDNIDFSLSPATRIIGRVTFGPDETPVPGVSIQLCRPGAYLLDLKDIELPNPEKSNKSVQARMYWHATTNEEGEFEFTAGRGKYYVMGPSQLPAQHFTITNEKTKEISFNTERPQKGVLKGIVVAGDPPKPVANAEVHGIYRATHAGSELRANASEEGTFEVERELHRTVLHAFSEDRTLQGVVEIDPDAKTVEIALQPVASAKGRLTDASTGNALANREIEFGVAVHLGDRNAPHQSSFGGKAFTDDNGQFVLNRLVVGRTYDISVHILGEENIRRGLRTRVGKITPDEPKEYALGDLTLKPPPPPYVPPTIEQRIDKAFAPVWKASDRVAATKRDAKLTQQMVLVVFGGSKQADAREYMRLRLEDEQVSEALTSFRLLTGDTSAANMDDANAIADEMKLLRPQPNAPVSMTIFDIDGKQLASADAAALHDSAGKFDKAKLLEFLKANTPPPLDAHKLLADALARAKTENKRVFLQETATWCGPCILLSQFLDKHRVWEKDYLWVKMDHRWTGAQEIMKERRGEADGGIPWIAILDADGKTLATSNAADGHNIGHPSKVAGAAHFRTMLEKSAIRMTPAEIASLIEALGAK